MYGKVRVRDLMTCFFNIFLSLSVYLYYQRRLLHILWDNRLSLICYLMTLYENIHYSLDLTTFSSAYLLHQLINRWNGAGNIIYVCNFVFNVPYRCRVIYLCATISLWFMWNSIFRRSESDFYLSNCNFFFLYFRLSELPKTHFGVKITQFHLQ